MSTIVEAVEAEPRPVVELMRLAQQGDREAFGELQRIGDATGISYSSGWTARLILYRLQDRASPTNLLARAGVEESLASIARDLSDPEDGAIERLIVARASTLAVEVAQADLEHLAMMQGVDDPWEAEVHDRRRDRAQRRLLQVLRALADVRRMNRPRVQVNQVAVGEGNTNVFRV